MVGSARTRKVLIYADENDHEPFLQWLEGLRDSQVRRQIIARLRRLEQGNSGDCKALQNGVFELRFARGPGYRVYFATSGNSIVILCGGDKSSQRKDVEKAIVYWRDYRRL